MQERIYVVEDDESIRRLLEFALESQGYQVSGFSNALEALEQMKAAPPELVLIDIMMEGMSGLEAVRLMRVAPQLRQVAVEEVRRHLDLQPRVGAALCGLLFVLGKAVRDGLQHRAVGGQDHAVKAQLAAQQLLQHIGRRSGGDAVGRVEGGHPAGRARVLRFAAIHVQRRFLRGRRHL